jgi:formylglycine-generating enzyme required for sulfatase activity/ketosteroid isomerase-like protein
MKHIWFTLVLAHLLFSVIGNQTLVFAQSATPPKIAAQGEMILIPSATYAMGIDKSEVPQLQQIFKAKRADIFSGELPRHAVKIDSFYLDKYEVTNRQFKEFLDQNPQWLADRIPARLHNGKYLQHWNGKEFPQGQANYPVVNVSWYAAVAFCQAQGKRLPTEAEWEYAARGGLQDKAFPWGDEAVDKTRANYGGSGIGAATSVGSYAANGYGLFDMAGNVWEYLADEWAAYPVTNEPLTNPVGGGDLFLNDSYLQVKTRRVIRGGSWGGSPINLRVTYRDSHPAEGAGDHVGFRCARSASLKENSGMTKTDDVAEAAAIPNKLFAAMREKNADAIRALFMPEGQLVAIDKPRDGQGLSKTRVFSADAFAKAIAGAKAPEFIEIMEHPKVEIFGDMALVYGRYTFHVGDKFSHCGTNSFHLVRTADGWKIANAASTLEFVCSQQP